MSENVEFFNTDGSVDNEDLPWVKDYYKSAVNPHEILEVLSLTPTEKGLFYLTTSAKGFIFKREKEYAFLIEALDIWVDSKKEVSPLILGRVNKKICFGLCHDRKKIYWAWEDGSRYVSKQVEPPTDRAWKPTLNPFLSDSPADTTEPSIPPPQSSKKRPPRSAQNEQEEASAT